ncbi:MAG: hypothetical protein AAGA26_06430 [Pseudomonadota bacterium]
MGDLGEGLAQGTPVDLAAKPWINETEGRVTNSLPSDNLPGPTDFALRSAEWGPAQTLSDHGWFAIMSRVKIEKDTSTGLDAVTS